MAKGFLKDIFFFLKSGSNGLSDAASILSWHSVSGSAAMFTVRPREFRRQIDYIVKKGYVVVKLSQLIDKLGRGEDVSNHVVLTFNDGYKDGYSNVFPVLKEHKLPATFFITVQLLDSNIKTSQGFEFETLSVKEIKEMQKSGLIEFMPETTHTRALDDLAIEMATDSVEAERQNVEALTKQDAPIFAYPKGRFTQGLIDHLQAGSWLGAVTYTEGLVRQGTNLFALPRNSVNSKTSFVQFKGKLSSAVEAYHALRK